MLLKGFARIALEPSEEKECTVTIVREDLRLNGRERGRTSIPENITIYVGKNAQDAENNVLMVD